VLPSVKAGSLKVLVSDPAGAPLAGAQVSIAGRTVQTNDSGIAELEGIAEGGYLLEADLAGWQPETVGVQVVFAKATSQQISAELRAADVSDVRLLFAGDLSFDDGIDDPNRDGVPDDSVVPPGESSAAGARALLGFVSPLLARFDLVTGNLATALGDGATPHPRKPTRALAPRAVAASFASSRIDVLNLGNDHAYDYLDDGVRQTLETLDAANVYRFGAGRDIGEASTPSLVSRLGFSVGQVGFSTLLGHGATPKEDAPPFYEAAPDKAGVVPATSANVKAGVEMAASSSDLVVAHLAAGTEWDVNAEPIRALAQSAVNSGAAFVVGHGSRPVQPVLKIGNTLAAVGLGQLVFGGQRPEGRMGLLLESQVRYRRLHEFRFWPISLVHYAPQLATGEMAARILRRLGALSQAELLIFPRQGRGEVALTPDAARTLESSNRQQLDLLDAGDGSAQTTALALLGGDLETFLVSVDVAVASGPEQAASIELGRELLWEGGFEDQAAGGPGLGRGAGWRYSAPDVGISDRAVHSGRLSLELVRKSGNLSAATAGGAGLLTLRAARRYSFSGCYKTEGDALGTISLSVFPSRQLHVQPISQVAETAVVSSSDWTCFQTEYAPPVDTLVHPSIVLERPEQGTARLMVDDLSLIEWDSPLQAGAAQVAAPNEVEYLRCRAPRSGGKLSVHWVTRRYLPR
jgi:poly-gamma-glutamate capsule biosynthesis protein CapA/YwtB (metallophosphatase superfamily)